MGLFYLAAAIKNEHEVLFWDACIDGDDVPNGYDVYGITVNITEVPWVRRFLAEHKPHNPQARYVLGGPYVSTAENIKIDNYDAIIKGEGEYPFQQYLATGEVNHAIWFHVVNELPFPARRLCRVERYSYYLSRKSGGYVRLDGDIPVGVRKATSLITSRGCPFHCAFCLAEGTLVLMADYKWQRVENVRVGDRLIGAVKNGRMEFQPSVVTDTFQREASLLEIRTENGTVYSSPEHPWLVQHDRWHKANQLKAGGYLRKVAEPFITPVDTTDYKRGYIAGAMMGDGHMKRDLGKDGYLRRSYRLVGDFEMQDAFQGYCNDLGIEARKVKFDGGPMYYNMDRAIVSYKQAEFEKVESIIGANDLGLEYRRGFLGGFYDADGGAPKSPRFHNVNEELLRRVEDYLRTFCFTTTRESLDHCAAVRVMGGRSEDIRLMGLIQPKVLHKRDVLSGGSVRNKTEILGVKPYGEGIVYNLETTTGNFIADGFVTHNCSKSPWDKQARFRTVDNILREVDEIVELGYTGLMIYDDTFTLKRQRILDFCERIERYDLLWKCFIRADRVDKELAFAMSRAGCVEVSIGIESGSQQILDGINKRTTVVQNTMACKTCKDAGISVRAFLILGLPGETHGTVAETRAWLDDNRPDSIGLGPLIPYPGSHIWAHPELYDIKINLPDDEEQWHYRGEPGHYNVYVSTSGLTSDEIALYIYEIEKDYGILGG